jgi:protein-S-isoprenylcysteine O-methyltransferase Ste14
MASPGWMIGLGSMILILGFLFGWRTFRNIPLRTILGLPEVEPSKNAQPLLHSGIYSRTRNPIYLTHSAYIIGLALVTGFAANWALLVLDIVLLPLTILAEERELIRRYGTEYVTYMHRVPRFFPKWPW